MTRGRSRTRPRRLRSVLPAARSPLLTAAGVLLAWAYVARVDPHEPGSYPVCPTLAVLGIACPACGGLRSAHSLAHGDVAAAFSSNALFVAALPVIAAAWVGWLMRSVRDGTSPTPPSPRLLAVLAAVGLVFTVVRNLPAGAFLAP